MPSHFKFISCLFLAAVVASQAQAAGVLPAQLAGLQTADAAMNGIGPGSPVARLAEEHGITCREYGSYLYQHSTQATQGLGS